MMASVEPTAARDGEHPRETKLGLLKKEIPIAS
jgi:hypothetical protein